MQRRESMAALPRSGPWLSLALLLAGCLAQPEPLLQGPHLAVRDVKLSPELLQPGQTLEIVATVANEGDDVGFLEATLRVAGEVVETGRSLQLWPGEAEEMRFYHQPAREGLLEVALAFSNGAWWNGTIRVGTPGIVLAGLELLPNPVLRGRPFTAFFKLANEGTAASTVSAQVFADEALLGRVDDITIEAGVAGHRSFTHYAEDLGTVMVKVLLSNGERSTAPLRVVAPELRFKDWGHDREGCEVRASITVVNQGDGPAEDMEVKLALLDEAGRVADEEVRALGSLAAGAQEDAHAALAFQLPCAPGPYRLRFSATAFAAEALEWVTPVLQG